MTSSSNLLGAFTIPFQHGLLVAEDSATRARHDNWDPSVEKVHVDNGSIYIAVQADVDGPVTVEVYDAVTCESSFADLIVRFEGEIPVTSKELRVCDSDNVAILSFRVHRDRLRIRCVVDDNQWPSRVVLMIG